MAEEFYQHDSEFETGARKNIGADFEVVEVHASVKPWMPAFAGMTIGEFRGEPPPSCCVVPRPSKPSSPRTRGSRDFRAMPR